MYELSKRERTSFEEKKLFIRMNMIQRTIFDEKKLHSERRSYLQREEVI